MGPIVAFIHAKGKSERLPGKNMADLGGQPLFTHAVRAAMQAREINRVIVDSDSDAILRIAKEIGAEQLKRPDYLATNATTGDDLARWQAGYVSDASIIVQVVPTCPFTRPETIDKAAEACYSRLSAMAVREERVYEWANDLPRYRGLRDRLPGSDELIPRIRETTGLYAVRAECARIMGRRYVIDDCGFIPVSAIEAIDINTQEDLDFARIVWKGLHLQ